MGIFSAVIAEKALHVVQEKSVGGVERYTTDNLKHILTYKDNHRQHRFKDESCTYCNKKGHTETVCFSKLVNEKLTKMAVKISAVMTCKITTNNNEALMSVLKEIKRLNLKGYGQLLPPDVEVLKTISQAELQKMRVTIILQHTVEIGWSMMSII